jgi:deoxyribodipyrimidine photo-lyase
MKLVWFRRDLRVEDNTALAEAIGSGEPVVALYVATPEQWRSHHMAPIQADLIYRRLDELSRELKHHNIPFLYHQVATFAESVAFIIQLAEQFSFSGIYYNKEYEWNEVYRDDQLTTLAENRAIEVVAYDDKCIQPPGSVLNQQGQNYKVFTPFKNSWLSSLVTPKIVKMPKANPFDMPSLLCEWLFDCQTSVFSYPRQSSLDWPVASEQVSARLNLFCQQHVADYAEERDFPIKEAGSRLSPYLALGILSSRQCLAQLMAESEGGVLSRGAEVWLSELVWREFYQHLIYFRPDIAKGNSFHSWADNLVWKTQADWLKRWQQGTTGYPIIDAAMRQLNTTGWMHNRLRMVVASFLTKDLHISWREGESYFMSKLIDGDYAANNGGWQWCASTGCDAQPYFRIFNPVSQGEKFDKQGEFVRFWLPELKYVPNSHIHRPWHWTNVSCLSYPEPIVDHKEEREITLLIYKDAKDK